MDLLRNAALQLYGGLVPRIVGQKKIRSEDSIYNAITIDEFFTRYPTLPNFLLTRLRQNFAGLVHPSLVPLLVLFSRISLGASNDNERNNDWILQFKEAFKDTFSSPVVNVRKLAARAYVNFTSKDKLIDEVENFCLEISLESHMNNYVDACLHCIHELIKMLKLEYREVLMEDYDRIIASVEKLACLHERNCCIKLNVLNIWKWFDVPRNEMINMKSKVLSCDKFSGIHPGYQDLTLENSKQDTGFKDCQNAKCETRKNCSQYISSVCSLNMEPNKLCRKILMFIEENSKSNVMTGKIFEECNEILLNYNEALYEDPELSMDILEFNNENQANLNQFGITASTTSLMVQAVCFSSMMTQSDYKMFFGDESVYVSMFSKMSDDIECYSRPNKMETCRIHSAQCLKYLITVFNKRNIKEDFDPLIMYAFVKLANTAFILLNDEDTLIREMVTEFISELRSDMPYPRHVSTIIAREKLVRYGLEQFSSCIEWFTPVEEVFFKPWIFDVNLCNNAQYPEHILRKVGVREYLFESGDGINVYIEEVGQNMHYSEVITDWLRENKGRLPFKLNINIQNIIEQITSVMKYADTHKNNCVKDFSGELWTNQGFLLLLRYFNVLRIIEEQPLIVNCGANQDEQNLIITYLAYVQKLFPLFINPKKVFN